MRPPPRPGFLLVARRELRWLLHDRAALALVFAVPLFAFVALAAAFSHPVIRHLGTVVVDQDRSETSRAFIERVAASPNLAVVDRTADLSSAARAIRAGTAIAALYIPPDFEHDLKAGQRPRTSSALSSCSSSSTNSTVVDESLSRYSICLAESVG